METRRAKNLTFFAVVSSALFLTLFLGWLAGHFGWWGLLLPVFFVIGVVLFGLALTHLELVYFLLIFFLPFERIPSFEFGGVTLRINLFIGALLLFVWALRILRGEKITSNILSLPLLLFLTAGAFSLIDAGNVSRGILVLIFTIFTVLLGVLTINVVRDTMRLRNVLLVLFATTLLSVGFGFFQFFGDLADLPRELTGLAEGYSKVVFGFPRIQAFSQEPLYLANFLFLPLGIGLALLWSKTPLLHRSWLIVLVLAILTAIVFTLSRGALVGLASMFLFFGIFWAKKVLHLRNILIGFLLLVSLGSVSYLIWNSLDVPAQIEFSKHIQVQDFSKGESIRGRLRAFQDAYQAYLSNPVLGIGLGNFGPYVKNYPPDLSEGVGWDIVNNEYLEILAETGIVGAIFFGIFLIALFIRSIIAYHSTNDEYLRAVLFGLLAAFSAMLVQYNFFSTLFIIHIWVTIGLLVAVGDLAFRHETHR